jgi:threonine dehydrogenase-like Zn-dependent dehydrogenase
VGAEVSHISPGDRVVVPFNIACGDCFMCKRGLQSQCETTQNRATRKGGSLFGYTHLYGAVPGGQAEYLRVPQGHYGPIKVPEGPPDERFLYLSDVLPTAWQAVYYAQLNPGDTLAVWGLGPIGQMSSRIALHQGAKRVIGVDMIPERLQLAERYGIETVNLRDASNGVEAVEEMTQGRGADAAIDAVGMEADGSLIDTLLSTVKLQPDKLIALHQSMGSVRRGGTLSISGVYAGVMHMFPLGDLFDKQITIRVGQANVRRWTPTILPLLVDDDPLGTEDLATHKWPLTRAPEAYEMFQKKMDDVIKVVLKPGH